MCWKNAKLTLNFDEIYPCCQWGQNIFQGPDFPQAPPHAQGGEGKPHLAEPASALGSTVIYGLKIYNSKFSLGEQGDDVLLNFKGFHHGGVPSERLPVLVEQNLNHRKSFPM